MQFRVLHYRTYQQLVVLHPPAARQQDTAELGMTELDKAESEAETEAVVEVQDTVLEEGTVEVDMAVDLLVH